MNTPCKLRFKILFFLIFLATNFLLACHQAPPDLKATWLGRGKKIADFKLQDHHHKIFTQEQLKGHWSLVFFGYTSCPDICPSTLATLKQTVQQLKQFKLKPPQIIFISVDPNRDTLYNLEQYTSFFEASFLGVTGSLKEISSLATQLGIVFIPKKADKHHFYLIDHSASLLLINPQGALQALWTMPYTAKMVSHDYRKIIEHTKP